MFGQEVARIDDTQIGSAQIRGKPVGRHQIVHRVVLA